MTRFSRPNRHRMHRQVLALQNLMSPAQYSVTTFATAFLVLHFHGLFVASVAALDVNDYRNAEVQCSTGSGLVAALKNPTVSSVALLSDVKLEDADFPASTGTGTAPGDLLLLARNFSIRGATEGRPVVLDFNYLRTKIILNGPIRLEFRNLFMVNLRRGSATQQPGYDILTVMPPSAGQRVPIVEIRDSALVYRYCFPTAIAAEALKMVARPVEVEPANTTAVLPFASPFVCPQYTSKSPVVVLGSAPPPPQQQLQEADDAVSAVSSVDSAYYQRIWARYGCFKAASLLADVAAYGGDMKEDNTPKSDFVKYPVHSINTTALCSDVLSDACIHRSTPLGCLLLTERLPRPPPPPAPPLPPALPPPAVATVTLPPPSSSSSRSVILGCTLGGVLALTVVIFGVLVYLRSRQVWWWRPRSACSSAAQDARGKSDDSGSANNAFAAPRWTPDPPSQPLPWAKNTISSPPGPAPHADGKTPQEALHWGQQKQQGGAPYIQARMAVAGAGAKGVARLRPTCSDGPCAATLADADFATDGTLCPVTQGAELAASGDDAADSSGLNDTVGRTLAGAGSWLYSSSPEHRDLMPVTHFTPLQPDINLDVRPDEAALQLTCVTLGKGASGRVVEGIYEGQRVAVKIIDNGLFQFRPPPPPMPPSKAAAEVALAVVAPSRRAQSDIISRDIDASGPRPSSAGAEVIGRSASAEVRQLLDEQGHQHPETVPRPASHCSIGVSAAAGGKDVMGGTGEILQGPAVVQNVWAATKLVHGSGSNAATSVNNSVTLISLARGDIVSFKTAVEGAVTTVGGAGGTPVTDGGATGGARASNPATSPGAVVCEEGDGERMFSAGSTVEHQYSTSPVPRQQGGEQRGNDMAAAPPAPAASGNAPGQQGAMRDCLDSMLLQEVEVLARCQHPNIVRLLAACLKPPRFCLVMELMDTSLDRLLHREGITLLPLDTVLHIAIQVSQGLAYLHPTIIHRDLKPGNVLITHAEKGRLIVKLADFGLSRLRDTVLVTRNPEVGTVPYIAPEAFDVLNNRITDRVDVYAFGVILWEMLSGRRPWHRVNMVAIAVNVSIMRRRPPLDGLSEARCPPKLRALIESCWEQIPERRPASAELVKLLAIIQAETRLLQDSKRDLQPSASAGASSMQ